MPKRIIYSTAERIRRGEHPNKNLRVLGPPGETVKQAWLDYAQKGGPRTGPFKQRSLYKRVVDYIKEKFDHDGNLDPRDDLITGLSKLV